MASLCESNTLAMSVDNKNKVEVGIPATSRRTNIRTFHLLDQAPDYHDHDFPNPNSELVPAGYEILRHAMSRSRSLSSPSKKKQTVCMRCYSVSALEPLLPKYQKTCHDKLGRVSIKWPRCGSLLVQLYPSRAIESTNVMHVNHLMSQIKDERKIREIRNVVAVADGGPDRSVKEVINFMFMATLEKLEAGLFCYPMLCTRSFAVQSNRTNVVILNKQNSNRNTS